MVSETLETHEYSIPPNTEPYEPNLNYNPDSYRIQKDLLNQWRQSMDVSPGMVGYQPNLSAETVALPTINLKNLFRRVFRI